jgi:hypothetical protein
LKTKELNHSDGSRSVESFDEQGLLKQVEDFDSRGKLSMRVCYAYDAKGHNTERIVTGEDGHAIRRLEFGFDEGGKMVEHREYNGRGSLQFVRKFEHGRPDGKIRVLVFDAAGKPTKESLEDFV